jgi:GTPase SAR1 family protein
MRTHGPLAYVRQNLGKVSFIGYVVCLTLLAGPLVGLIKRGWEATESTDIVWQLLLAAEVIGVDLMTIEATLLGVTLVSLTMMTIDRKKRVQGILLWCALGLVGVGFVTQNFVPRVFFELRAHLWQVALGAVGTVVICVPRSVWRSWARLEAPVTLEFRRAPFVLYWILVIVVGLMWAEGHIIYPQLGLIQSSAAIVTGPLRLGLDSTGIINDTLAAAGYVFIAKRFVSYDAESKWVVLGPSGAGKSTFMLGTWSQLDRHRQSTDGRIDTIGKLDKLIAQASNAPVDEWAIENTDSASTGRVGLTVESGTVFPKNLRVELYDYPGEYFSELAETVGGATPTASADPPESTASTEVVETLQQELEDADTILCLVDVRRIQDDTASQLHHYSSIVREYRDDKRLVPVATKADLYDTAFEYKENADPYDRQNYDEFSEFVTKQLRQSSDVRNLLNQMNADKMYPAYVMTEEDENGTRYPVDVDGRRAYYGHREILEVIA